jgi:succinoglycan biosynthesis transport protein ExoP
MNHYLTQIDGQQQVGVQELTLLHIWEIVQERRQLIFGIIFAAVGLAVLVAVFSTRKYEAKAEIQIQKDSSDALGLDAMIGGATGSASDALDANVTLQTQAKILESQTLALSVIDRLHLAETPDFTPKFSLMGWATGWMNPKGPSDPHGVALGDSPNKRDRLFKTFQKNTKVAPVAGTRLIEVTYTSTDPNLAAPVVNQLIESLIDYNFQTRYTATSQTSEWLGKQLSELRTSSDGLQRQVADLQRSSEMFSFGGEDLAGKGVVYSSVLDQLQQTTVNLTQAQSNRILRGAVYEAAKSGNPEALATLSGSGLTNGSSAGTSNSLALLQTLRSQEATQKAQMSEVAAKFGPTYPKLEELHANLASVEQSIRDEQTRLGKQTRSDYEIAQQIEDRTRKVFEGQKKSAEALNDKAIQYQLLRQEADQSRELYSRLQSRLKEAGVLEGLRSSNITIVEPGRTPARPSSPNVPMLLAGAMFGGAFLGLGYAFGKEVMGSRIHNPQLIASSYGSSYFGGIPYDSNRLRGAEAKNCSALARSVRTLSRPHSAYSESLRSLRTAIMFPGAGRRPKVLLVTSPGPQEGKSTVSANLAVLLAQQGKRVLLVDADLRRSTLHRTLVQAHSDGLSTFLDGNDDPALAQEYAVSEVRGLFFIPAGPVVCNPSDLLGSDRFRQLVALWRERFDCIVIDSSPLLAVTDSVLLAPLVDQILLVGRYEVTETADLMRSYRLLEMRAPETPVGVVVNGIKHTKANEYYSYTALDEDVTPNRKGSALHA